MVAQQAPHPRYCGRLDVLSMEKFKFVVARGTLETRRRKSRGIRNKPFSEIPKRSERSLLSKHVDGEPSPFHGNRDPALRFGISEKKPQQLCGELKMAQVAKESPLRLDPHDALTYHLRVGTKAFNPTHVGLATKPRHLPLGIVPVSLLGGCDGLRQREFTF